MTRVRTLVIALSCVLAALVAGLWLGGHPDSLPAGVRDTFVEEDRAVREEVLDEIEDSYIRKVDSDRLQEQSLKGIVRALDDPFSHYLSPKEAKEFRRSISGEFEGVGMTVDEDRRGLRVLNVFDDTPAERAGIDKGDLITAVDGKSIAGVSARVATGRIKGPSGTRVSLEVVDAGTKRARRVSVTRRRIEIPVARGRIVTRDETRLGLVQLATFSQGAHGLLRRQVDRVRRRGARGILLDLRGNGGGLLQEAVLVASTFVENGDIVSVRGRTRPSRTEEAQGNAIPRGVPVVVLVDRGSASASEIVAGALRDRGRATIAGTRTFGKGLVQEVEPLSNGGVLDLTVARYYLPSGRTISRKGLKPQVDARDNPRTRADEGLRRALEALLAATR